ncbi:hypothetical protein SAMN04487917_101555 [Arthrobacter sp. yr096]|uniref:hypothetical protein n=1 Tax=Arthrobacter sp. yr096 TaxID=1761750 RepID=UPI0008B73F4F|nr:hypothetical protein [Arthrobacter sp. yr096]SEI48728.1 hypothetical protein SAMN04487917_101555 [Arthrobacter sp. yr096]
MTTQTEEIPALLITEHELIALIALAGTDAALRCQTLFRLDHASGAPLEQAGVSTLLERGLMKIDNDSLQPVGPAATVTAVLADATSWLETALVTPTSEHVSFMFGAEQGALLLNLNKYGVHELHPLTGSEGMIATAVQMADYYLNQAPDGFPAAATTRQHFNDGTSRAVHVKAEADGSLSIAAGEGENLKASPLSPEQFNARIRAGLEQYPG